jgi:hypothetical protein
MTGSQEALPSPEAPSQADAPPLSAVALALSVGALLVGGTTAGGYLLTREAPAPAGAPPIATPSTAAAAIATRPVPVPAPDWTASLADPACPAPCAGGSTCASKPVECTSGFACVPGLGTEPIGDHELWTLHLSAVQEVDATGQPVDPCYSQKDFWVCRRGTEICVSQADACANAGKGTAAIAVTGSELNHVGLSLDVHMGGPTGPLVAVTTPIRNLLRGGLCRGFSVKATGGAVAKVTYFVLPR